MVTISKGPTYSIPKKELKIYRDIKPVWYYLTVLNLFICHFCKLQEPNLKTSRMFDITWTKTYIYFCGSVISLSFVNNKFFTWTGNSIHMSGTENKSDWIIFSIAHVQENWESLRYYFAILIYACQSLLEHV